MSNTQLYEKFCTRVDVAELVGVQYDSFKCLWDYCIEQKGWAEYNTLTSEEQAMIRSKLKKQLFAYLLIKKSSSTTNHDSIQNNLLELYIAKQDEYPVDRSDAIAILNKYSEKSRWCRLQVRGPHSLRRARRAIQRRTMRKQETKRKMKNLKITLPIRNALFVEKRVTRQRNAHSKPEGCV